MIITNYELISELIPSTGITINGLFRGLLGILSILILAFLMSANKKKIAWKTIFLALIAQLTIGVLILKVKFFQIIFEKAGSLFVKLIDFTREGTIFVFGGKSLYEKVKPIAEHTKKLINALNENLIKYEKVFGDIKNSQSEVLPISFGPRGEA